MQKCPYYKTERQRLESDERHSHQQTPPSRTIVYPWCGFVPSAVSYEEAHTFGGPSKLRCGGDLETCQLPESDRPV